MSAIERTNKWNPAKCLKLSIGVRVKFHQHMYHNRHWHWHSVHQEAAEYIFHGYYINAFLFILSSFTLSTLVLYVSNDGLWTLYFICRSDKNLSHKLNIHRTPGLEYTDLWAWPKPESNLITEEFLWALSAASALQQWKSYSLTRFIFPAQQIDREWWSSRTWGSRLCRNGKVPQHQTGSAGNGQFRSQEGLKATLFWHCCTLRKAKAFGVFLYTLLSVSSISAILT